VPEPTLLAIDTAGACCSLALAHGGRVHAHRGETGLTHLEHVMPMVERLFARCGLSPRDCDAFAFACGPGSFTGLRVACTIVQGLALGTGRPVIAVGHLDVLLRAGLQAADGADWGPAAQTHGPARALTILDARMEQAYWAAYEQRDGAWVCTAAPNVGGRDELRQALGQWRPAFIAGDGAWIHRYIGAVDIAVRDVAVEASVLVGLAQEQFARGAVLAPQLAVPLYVRDRVAQTVAERREPRVVPLA
jgi:tRNA threonylcarbamoyladenosine biosynthesis protein TsaB